MTNPDPVYPILRRHPEATFLPVAIEEYCGIYQTYLCMIATDDGGYTFERTVESGRVHWYIINTETGDREQVIGDSLEWLFTDVVVRDHPVYDVTVN